MQLHIYIYIFLHLVRLIHYPVQLRCVTENKPKLGNKTHLKSH